MKRINLLIVLPLLGALLGGCADDKALDATANHGELDVHPASDQPPFSSTGHDVGRLPEAKIKELTKDLDPLELEVTCMSGTERAFTGELWNNKKDGVYLCKVCSLPLFESGTKFESGTGWPSFFRPYDPEHIEEIKDTSHGMVRIEVRCRRSGTHLGHRFPDGPKPTGQRYCINSASLEFVKSGEPLPAAAQPARKP
ncbi:MAG: peptide-methionine (R)-S-oxide reductase MsrB [Planctomycetes bacterium]|nr:peptide-methionine (R)-S-oxide reductase MsrB [Planctomycetota bacterium]